MCLAAMIRSVVEGPYWRARIDHGVDVRIGGTILKGGVAIRGVEVRSGGTILEDGMPLRGVEFHSGGAILGVASDGHS